MIRFFSRLLVLSLGLLLLFPTSSASSAGKAYLEGIHVDSLETHHNALTIMIDAVKHVDGQSHQSQIHILYHYNYVDGSRDFEATVDVGEDADQLEVSRDLGWGGLDTVIYVQQRRVDCVFNPDRTCGAEIVETVPVEIHLALTANADPRQEGNLFKRNATISGTIQTPQLLTTLTLGQGMASAGYNFSDQSPR